MIISILIVALLHYSSAISTFLPDENIANNPICYGIVFDAGSSGTRVYVYNWQCRTKESLPFIKIGENAPERKKVPGLSTFANNTAGIGDYLQSLILFAEEHVPANLQQYTAIMLGATAGLRMLSQTDQNAIISQVQLIFSQTNFLYFPEWVRVISGQDEGAYLWMSIYYLLQGQTSGLLTIDLGGASTQIAMPQPNTQQDVVVLSVPNYAVGYDLYSVSYLNYGNDIARDVVIGYSITQSNIIQTPCYHQGYMAIWDKNTTYTIMGTGNMFQCQLLISQYLNVSTIGSINGGYQPQITNQTIYGVSGITNIADFYHMTQFTLPQFYLQTAQYTSMNWAQVQQQYHYDPFAATNYFLGVYVYQLLSIAYKIPDNQIIYSPKLIDGVTPSWTLSACSYELAQINCNYDSPICKTHSITISMSIIFVMSLLQ